MSAIEFHEFNEKYGTLLLRSWTSEDFLNTLLTDPHEAFAEVGLAVPAATEIVLRRTDAAATEGEGAEGISEAAMQRMHELWLKGVAAGRVVLSIPEVPKVDLSELADTELEMISGGVTIVLCCIIVACCLE